MAAMTFVSLTRIPSSQTERGFHNADSNLKGVFEALRLSEFFHSVYILVPYHTPKQLTLNHNSHESKGVSQIDLSFIHIRKDSIKVIVEIQGMSVQLRGWLGR